MRETIQIKMTMETDLSKRVVVIHLGEDTSIELPIEGITAFIGEIVDMGKEILEHDKGMK